MAFVLGTCLGLENMTGIVLYRLFWYGAADSVSVILVSIANFISRSTSVFITFLYG